MQNPDESAIEFVRRWDHLGSAPAESYLKQNFDTPAKYIKLLTMLLGREPILVRVLEMFREVLASTWRETTFAQANYVLSIIINITRGQKAERFHDTFDALATLAVISFERGVDKLDSALAKWVGGPRGAEFHLFHGDLQMLIPYGLGFIPDVLKHWLEVRPDVLAKSEALRILGPKLICVLVNSDVICHEIDDTLEDDAGFVDDRICQVMSLDPPQFNVWDTVASREAFWVSSKPVESPQKSMEAAEVTTFKKIHAWRLHGKYNGLNNDGLYYWEDGGFHKVSAFFELTSELEDVAPVDRIAINNTPVSIPEHVEYLYAMTQMTRENTGVSWV